MNVVPSENIGVEIALLALWNHRIERVLAAEAGLAVHELHCMLQIFLHEPGSARALAEILGVRDTSLSKLLRSLQKRGLVDRGATPDDRRIECVRLTSTGTQLAERILGRASEIGAEVLERLPEERRSQFRRCLNVIVSSKTATASEPPASEGEVTTTHDQ